MYRLRDLKNGLYQIHSKNKGQAYEGTPKQILEKAVELGVQTQDLIMAVQQLQSTGHDYADFTSWGRFEYTIGKKYRT